MFCCNVAAKFEWSQANESKRSKTPETQVIIGLEDSSKRERKQAKTVAVITNQLLCQLSYAGNRDGQEYAISVALSPAPRRV